MKNAVSPKMGFVFVLLVLVLLAGLPVAVWLDLNELDRGGAAPPGLRSQFGDQQRARLLREQRGRARARLCPDLDQSGAQLRGHSGRHSDTGHPFARARPRHQRAAEHFSYRFVSDYPFEGRAPHALDPFEKNALQQLREGSNRKVTAVSASLFSDKVRIWRRSSWAQACVSCHNTHPDSPKRDWKVGDVRGIQEVTISQPLAANIFSFKYLLGYFVFMAASGIGFIGLQRNRRPPSTA